MPNPDKEHRPLLDAHGQPLKSSLQKRQQFKQAIEFLVGEKYRKLLEVFPSSLRWIIVLIGAVGLLLYSTYSTWSKWPLYEDIMAGINQRSLPTTKQFAIAVARIEGDDADAIRTLIMDSLRDLRGVQPLRFDRPTKILLADDPQEEERRTHVLAIEWLQESKADILLWGQVLPAAGTKERMVRIFFTAKDSPEHETARIKESEAIQIPVSAREPLEAVVRTQVLARISAIPDSHPVAHDLQLEIQRLEVMISNWEEGETRAVLHQVLGDALQTVGDQLGEAKPLEKAIAAYQEALKELTRERVPLQWAMTQNNLGIALQTLGERESGTARLEEAVSAYRNALEVFQASESGYYIEITQCNLQTVLELLEKR
nr:tetratricopeptide repeat protein [Desulfobacula sp.]